MCCISARDRLIAAIDFILKCFYIYVGDLVELPSPPTYSFTHISGMAGNMCGNTPLLLPRSTLPTGSCAKVAEWQTALDLLAQLRAGAFAKGGEPLLADTVSFNATINALGRGGEWEKALALLREMSKAGGNVAVSNERKHPPV